MKIQTTVQPKGRERVATFTSTNRQMFLSLREFDRLLHCGKIEFSEGAWREVNKNN